MSYFGPIMGFLVTNFWINPEEPTRLAKVFTWALSRIVGPLGSERMKYWEASYTATSWENLLLIDAAGLVILCKVDCDLGSNPDSNDFELSRLCRLHYRCIAALRPLFLWFPPYGWPNITFFVWFFTNLLRYGHFLICNLKSLSKCKKMVIPQPTEFSGILPGCLVQFSICLTVNVAGLGLSCRVDCNFNQLCTISPSGQHQLIS